MILAIILGVVFLLLLAIVYTVAYVYNKKTKIPKGCEIAFLEAQTCGTCYVSSCSMRQEEPIDKE